MRRGRTAPSRALARPHRTPGLAPTPALLPAIGPKGKSDLAAPVLNPPLAPHCPQLPLPPRLHTLHPHPPAVDASQGLPLTAPTSASWLLLFPPSGSRCLLPFAFPLPRTSPPSACAPPPPGSPRPSPAQGPLPGASAQLRALRGRRERALILPRQKGMARGHRSEFVE